MKKIRISIVVTLAMFVLSLVSVVSASAATVQWLAGGAMITSAEPSLTTGELVFGSTNGLKLGLRVEILCSFTLDGTKGPGAQDEITSMLSLTGVTVTLAAPLVCVPVSGCTSATLAPVNLPWLSQLTSTTDDIWLPGAGGNPGWEIVCITSLGTVEETCTVTKQLSAVKNGASGEVEGTFVKEQTFTCSIGGANSGFTESSATDAVFLITLVSKAALTVSEA